MKNRSYIEQTMQANQETVLFHLLSELEKIGANLEPNTNTPRTLGKLIHQADFFLHQGIWSEHEWQQHVFPLLGFTTHAHTYALRKSLFCKGEHTS